MTHLTAFNECAITSLSSPTQCAGTIFKFVLKKKKVVQALKLRHGSRFSELALYMKESGEVEISGVRSFEAPIPENQFFHAEPDIHDL